MASSLKLLANPNNGSKEIPSLRSVSEEVRRLESLRTDIGSKRNSLMSERAKLADELQSANSFGALTQSQGPTKEAAAIAAILGDPPPLPSTAPIPTGIVRLRQISEELRILDSAEQEMTRRLIAARRAASVVVCEHVRDVHAALAGNLLQALKVVHRANVEYTEFSDRMNSENISWSDLNPILPRFLGDPGNIYAPLARFLLEAEEAGWLKHGELPKEFLGKGK